MLLCSGGNFFGVSVRTRVFALAHDGCLPVLSFLGRRCGLRLDKFIVAYRVLRPGSRHASRSSFRRSIEGMSATVSAPQADQVPSGEPAANSVSVPRWAGRTGFGLWLLVTGLVGAAASFLLLYERVQLWNDPDHVTACDVNPWVSCGEVMQSWQASTFGFPNIFIGVVAFPVLIAVAVSLLAGGRFPKWYYAGLQAGVVFAFGFCVWLWASAVFVIGVLCPYCMIVWSAVIPLFVVTTARNIIHGVIPASAGVKKLAADWWWVGIVVIYLLVFASIMINFPYAFTTA